MLAIDREPVNFMNESIVKLEKKYSVNQQLIDDKKNKVALLLDEVVKLEQENEHIAFSLGFLKSQIDSNGQSRLDSDKKSLRAMLLDLIKNGETVTIDEAWNRVSEYGIDTTKPTINTTLHILFNDGLLEKPSKGLYKKPD